MKFKTSTLIWTFIWCLFMGITAGSIGIGAVFPSINLIAKPFVCPDGEMRNESQYYQVSPVESVTTITWYCIDPRGDKTELDIFPMSLYAGTIYGLLLFVAVFIGMTVMASRRGTGPQAFGGTGSGIDMDRLNALVEESRKLRGSLAADQEKAERMASKTKAATTALARMKELKELRAANEISEAEYEKKRAEILKDL